MEAPSAMEPHGGHRMGPDRGPQVCAVTITVTITCVIVVATRLWLRAGVLRSVGWDDWILFMAMLCACALTYTTFEQVEHGLGRHDSELTREETEAAAKFFFFSIILYNLALGLTKVSILVQYLRIFGVTRWMRIGSIVTLVFVMVHTLETVVMSVFGCSPVSYFWTHEDNRQCLDIQVLYLVNGAINIITDIVIVVLPMPAFRSLKIPQRERYALMGIFAFGSFGCVTSILRLDAVRSALSLGDITWSNTDIVIWSTVEVFVGITCASLPSLKILAQRVFPRLLYGPGATRGQAGGIVSVYGGDTMRARDRMHMEQLRSTTRAACAGAAGSGIPGSKTVTTVGRGNAGWDSEEEEAGIDVPGGIKITTTVSQHMDCKEEEASCEARGNSEVHSITDSERKLFTRP